MKTKKLIILLAFLIVETSFTNIFLKDNFNYFQKLYNEDKEKCFLLAKSKVDNNTTNFAPYYFLLKIELEKYKEIPYVWSHNTSDDRYDMHIESMHHMINYTNKIYDFANEEELYETNCFYLFGEMNDELGGLCRDLQLADKLSLKEKLLKRANSFFSIEIEVLGSGSTSSRTSQDVRISKAYPNTEVSKFFNGIPTGNEDIPSSDISVELEFLQILNGERIERGLNPLSLNQDLCRAARYHSYDMGSQNYTGHATQDRPNNGAKLVEVCGTFTRVRKFSNCSRENIAMGTRLSTALRVYEGWYNSPGHNKNMFAPDTKEIGIGFIEVSGSKMTYYWTTDFY